MWPHFHDAGCVLTCSPGNIRVGDKLYGPHGIIKLEGCACLSHAGTVCQVGQQRVEWSRRISWNDHQPRSRYAFGIRYGSAALPSPLCQWG